MFYIIHLNYTPNNAVANRLCGYFKAIDNIGIQTKVFFLLPGINKDKIKDNYTNVEINYLWDENKNYSRLSKLFLYYRNLYKLGKIVKAGDTVYTYGVNKIIRFFQRKKGIKTFAERTEHPLVVKYVGHRIFNLSFKDHMDTCKRLDGLFVISRPLRDYYIEQGVEKNKIHIINMTVDSKRFDNLKKEPTEKYIAYCGTASNNKDGVDELIKAFSLVAKEVNDVKLYIIGKTPNASDEAGNLRLIDILGLRERVVFTGIVPSSDIPQLLINAEVLALDRPDSLQARCGFPTKLGEYLLTCNPVVCTKVGDIPHFLKDGETALLAQERNPIEFSSKIVWALTHKQEAVQIGKNGALLALKSFNSEIETSKMMKIIFGN